MAVAAPNWDATRRLIPEPWRSTIPSFEWFCNYLDFVDLVLGRLRTDAYPLGETWRLKEEVGFLFSMIILLTAGIMRVFDGIWMIHNGNTLHIYLQGSLLGSSLKTYGWFYLLVGIVLILSALALSSGSELARWIGVFAGVVLSVSAVWWIYYQPIWALVYIGIGIGIIYGLVAYGGHQGAMADSSTDTTNSPTSTPTTD